jgi:glucuronate isomerase
MSQFPDENFLLKNEYAKKLFHDHVSKLPIIDYHCHLLPEDIAKNRQFENLTQIWLEGDHYKWRAMRTMGVNEKYITGNASDAEKFEQWAYTVPFTIRNPLYHWSHLELKRYFGNNLSIKPETAKEIYQNCSDKLRQPDYGTRNLLIKMNVEVVGTTDDPTDSLEHHTCIRKSDFKVLVRPTFRPDKSFAIENPEAWKIYLGKLSIAANVEIQSFTKLIEALEKRVDFFNDNGCRSSDHGLEQLYYPDRSDIFNIDLLFGKLWKGEQLTKPEREFFKYAVLLALGKLYNKKGWVQQFHLGALRNTNERMLTKLGPDTGFDSIGDFGQASPMAAFFNELDKTNELAKTIVYNLNPAYNEVMATMIGNFNDGSMKGKMQFGSAWWYLDQKDGMEKQINALSNLGLLSCFIGMITDSRSFLSYPRHEYFRRILCNLIGEDVENGELSWDEKWLGKIVADVCYYNAKSYFNFS